MIRVVVADDETLFRSGLAMIVEAQSDLEMVAEAKDGHEAVEAVRRHRPDVVLMDIQMPVLDGIKATKEIVRLGLPTRVLILTTFGIDRNVYAALRAGASGFLLKTVPPSQLVDGVRVIASGDMLLAPAITRRLIEELVQRPMAGIRDSQIVWSDRTRSPGASHGWSGVIQCRDLSSTQPECRDGQDPRRAPAGQDPNPRQGAGCRARLRNRAGRAWPSTIALARVGAEPAGRTVPQPLRLPKRRHPSIGHRPQEGRSMRSVRHHVPERLRQADALEVGRRDIRSAVSAARVAMSWYAVAPRTSLRARATCLC